MTKVRNIVSVLVLLLLPVLSYGQYRDGNVSYRDLYDSDVVSALKAHVSYLSSRQLEGRAAGSEGEKMAADYMQSMFKAYGLDLLSPQEGDLFGIRKESGDTLTSRNVIAYMQGSDPKLRDRYVVIGARLDNMGKRTMTVDGEASIV